MEGTGTGCAAECKPERGSCETINGNMQCVCKTSTMWRNGNDDGSTNLNACNNEMCPGRCGMDDATGKYLKAKESVHLKHPNKSFFNPINVFASFYHTLLLFYNLLFFV